MLTQNPSCLTSQKATKKSSNLMRRLRIGRNAPANRNSYAGRLDLTNPDIADLQSRSRSTSPLLAILIIRLATRSRTQSSDAASSLRLAIAVSKAEPIALFQERRCFDDVEIEELDPWRNLCLRGPCRANTKREDGVPRLPIKHFKSVLSR